MSGALDRLADECDAARERALALQAARPSIAAGEFRERNARELEEAWGEVRRCEHELDRMAEEERAGARPA